MASQGGSLAVVNENYFQKRKDVNDNHANTWPLYWIDANTASSLYSEYLLLLRSFSSQPGIWFDKIKIKVISLILKLVYQFYFYFVT